MSTRAELATALNAVEGIRAHAYYEQGTRAGLAYVRLERIEYPNPFGGVARWSVVVILPQDLAKAERFVEDNLPALHEAVDPHLAITSAELQRINFDSSGVLLALIITGHREADTQEGA